MLRHVAETRLTFDKYLIEIRQDRVILPNAGLDFLQYWRTDCQHLLHNGAWRGAKVRESCRSQVDFKKMLHIRVHNEYFFFMKIGFDTAENELFRDIVSYSLIVKHFQPGIQFSSIRFPSPVSRLRFPALLREGKDIWIFQGMRSFDVKVGRNLMAWITVWRPLVCGIGFSSFEMTTVVSRKTCAYCRSWQGLEDDALIAKFGADTAERTVFRKVRAY